MMSALVVSNILLWILVVILLVIVYALARQIGVLHERVAPVGALMPTQGPKVGETIPSLSVPNLNGDNVALFTQGSSRTLIYFLSPTCPICKSLLPVVQKIEQEEAQTTVIYASDGETTPIHQRYAAEQSLPFERYVLSQELGMQLAVNKLPFAALIDAEGVLKGRGLVNSREHIESLMVAESLDVSSLQEYLGMDQEKSS